MPPRGIRGDNGRMGLFQQRPEEEERVWAGLPSEPRDIENPAERLDDAPAMDLMDIGVGAKYSTMVFPVAPPAPEAADVTDGEPGGDDPDAEG